MPITENKIIAADAWYRHVRIQYVYIQFCLFKENGNKNVLWIHDSRTCKGH